MTVSMAVTLTICITMTVRITVTVIVAETGLRNPTLAESEPSLQDHSHAAV